MKHNSKKVVEIKNEEKTKKPSFKTKITGVYTTRTLK